MKQIPSDQSFDSTIALSLDGYNFIMKRCERFNSDLFQTRLLLQKTICMKGEEAARLFYNTDLFERKGVVPNNIQLTLFGQGGVQGLDDKAHYHRKEMFLDLMSPESIDYLVELTLEQWQKYAEKWEQKKSVILFYEAQELICKAVCAWCGIPLKGVKIKRMTNNLAVMIDGSGSVGPRHWRARLARRRTEKWVAGLVQKVRDEALEPAEKSALYQVSLHHDLRGNLLNKHTAAVELINILRPTVAVARYIVFAALSMYRYPEVRTKLQNNDEKYLQCFVHEVRRYYPFFPFVMARTRQAFEWKGYRFSKNRNVLLDLYGTNHDNRIWNEPYEFKPERFENRKENSYDFIPQGGGDHHQNHRCPGEWITIELMKSAVQFLVNDIRYHVPDQNLSMRLSRTPAIPHSRFRIKNVIPRQLFSQ